MKFLILALALSSLSAFAADCENTNHSLTPQEAIVCANKYLSKQDKALNVTYQKLGPLLKNDEQKKLVAAQKAWITFRDSDCAFKATQALTEWKPSLLIDCKAIKTQQRNDELKLELAARSEDNF